METRLKLSAATFRIAAFPNDLMVLASPRLLTTTIINVLDNAMKYSNGPPDITMKIEDSKKHVLIEVCDKGIGLNRKEAKRIFKRFYRASDPASHATPGTGLGLYFARLAIRAQGGNITVQSAGLGLGTTFQIEIPKK